MLLLLLLLLLLRTDDAAMHELRFTVDDNKERIVLKSVTVCSLKSVTVCSLALQGLGFAVTIMNIEAKNSASHCNARMRRLVTCDV